MAVRSQAATSVAPDDYEAPALTASRLLLRPGESERVASLRWDDSNSSDAQVSRWDWLTLAMLYEQACR
jgi:hypothetical protein